MRASFDSLTFALALILLTNFNGSCFGHLQVGFYHGKCGQHNVEKIIFDLVKKEYEEDPDTVADILRLVFHDCFVRGCDASILLDGEDTEKTAKPNLGAGGFDTVDRLKKAVEKACPGVVSCADILWMGARSAVYAAGGKWFEVETGRRDGLVSDTSEALAHLPSPSIPVPMAIQIFSEKGLSTKDFVALLGAHTVGTAHCHSFKERLYNYYNTSEPDPTMGSTLLQLLQKTCSLHNQTTTSDKEAFLDQTPKSHFKFDNGYYKQIMSHKGLLEIDQQLYIHPQTRETVTRFAHCHFLFLDEFGQAMIKMSRIGVLTGDEGEIRKSCRARN